jgi:hypothetical protein
MPPQQSDRLLGGIRELFDLGAHLVFRARVFGVWDGVIPGRPDGVNGAG